MRTDATPEDLARGFDLQSLPPAFIENPYPTYHALRNFDPVRRMPDGSLFLTRYADMVTVYRDPRLYSSDKKVEFGRKFGVGSPLYRHHTGSLVFNDPPLHTRVRRLLTGALSQRALNDTEPDIVALVDRLLDRAGAMGRFDLIEDFAALIPVEVIGNLLGVPPERRGPLREWSLAILGALEPVLTPERERRGTEALLAFRPFLQELITERRAAPRDPWRDVLTRLIVGEGADRLSEDELIENCTFLLNAGHETTTNLIGNALVCLLDWPDQRERLLADPELIRMGIEELLRFESSTQLGNRISTAAGQIGGVAFERGTPITLCIGAANRDPAAFEDPDRLDLGRWPNRHLAFGFGTHLCAGLSLARLEGRIAIGRFLQRFPRYRAAGPRLHGGRARFRGWLSVPVAAD
ncbi:Cytochrome P450 [Rhodovastum atsumiense]|uniref:Cytochrome P450 n=1 Tax=Rhodovastum atsumiense TaxID=504468 RepID=A0A5M6J253_9PROT|nr:cytochrome P450 [Rhodovastum atsumiense]KAA5613705.1 cytochrome P450 [Rhodovastum atsumiense]CAH2599628.1 Cytochrome P450 [Rhodovastum atsumiense]